MKNSRSLWARLTLVCVLSLALGAFGCADDPPGGTEGPGGNGGISSGGGTNGGSGTGAGTSDTSGGGGTGGNTGTGGTGGTGGTDTGGTGTGGTGTGGTGTGGTGSTTTPGDECIDSATEPCDGLDNNCNGTVDEGCSCGGLFEQACYTGPPSTRNVGSCRSGVQTCDGEFFGECQDAILPDWEVCDGEDNDCDGQVDEGFGVGESCNTGDGGCASQGVAICNDAGNGVVCDAVAVEPGEELCDNLDNDCDGQVDEVFTDLGDTCSTGIGACENAGLIVCSEDGIGTVCNAQPRGPQNELCDGIDNNCNGSVDEAFAQVGQPCEVGVGACAATGVWVCSGDGLTAVCNATPGTPQNETCDGVDNNCDGQVDEPAECSNSGPVLTCPDTISAATLDNVTVTANAVDPDGDPMTYLWELVEAPIGSGSQLSPTNQLSTNLWLDIAGDFRLRFTATDSSGVASSCETLVQSVPAEQFRVELLWNVGVANDPSDVDLHLLNKDSGAFWVDPLWDCYYGNCNSSRGDVVDWGTPSTGDNPRLDVDDVEGNGPENINIDNPADGTYRVGVHYYNDDGFGPSNVIVRIYCNAQLVREFEPVTLTGNGSPDDNDFWLVADVEWDGPVCRVVELGSAGNREIITYGSARSRQ